VGKRSSRQQVVYLPLVLCATFFVTVCPIILVWWLHDSGVVTSVWVGIAIGVAVSFGASCLGAALWKTRTDSRDVLFGELMLWGWAQRWRAERRLATATDVLGLRHGPRRSVSGGSLTHEQQAGLLTQLASGLEGRDPYTHGHSRRVARHASNIAKRMGLPAAEVAKIRTAGVMHDVGKVNTPTAVLHKEGKLTDGEFKVIKRHPVEGATMVSTLGDDELTAMVRHHHERLDGTGYPDGLAGDAIPLGARILAVADTFDAITSTRPYRPAHAHKKALDILRAEAGAQLDPNAVRAFCSCYIGYRSLILWTILANGPPRLAGWLGGGLSTAKAASVANVMATAAATTAVGGAALGPLVEAPTHSQRAAEAATAPGPAPAARQRPRLTPAAGHGGSRPVNARRRGRGHGFIGTIAPGTRHGRRTGHAGNGAPPPGGAPGSGQSGGPNTAPSGTPGHSNAHGQGGNAAPNGAPGHSNGNGKGGNSAPRGEPGQGNGQGGNAAPRGKHGPDGATTLPHAETGPAGGKGPAGKREDVPPGRVSP
jgi:putative nucleotidyltransferase with HDIG domain